MDAVLQSIFTIILSVKFTMGNLGNGFIVLVNCMDWVKRRKISSVDQILTALAISWIAQIWVVFIDCLVSASDPASQMTRKLRMTYIAWAVSNHFNLWISTSLSIFYCLKIANFSNTIFLYLKFRVKKVVSVTLMASLFLLCLNILFIHTYVDMLVNGAQRNLSYSFSLGNSVQITTLLSFTNPLFMVMPLTVSLTAFLLLIFSMWKHLRKMQHNAQGCRDARITAHIRALQTLIASILLYIIFVLLLFMKVWSSELQVTYLCFFLIWAFGMAVPSVHSFVLIRGNGRLRRACFWPLRWLRCRFKSEELQTS